MSGTESDGDRAASRRRAAPGRRQPRPRQPLPPPEMPQPPPRYRWMRPRMQGFSGQINLYIRDDVLSTIPEVLTRVGGDALYQRFRDGPFGYLIQIRRYESANNVLHELLARELEDDNFSEFERMFHVAGRDILFRAQEYALVTGLFFGPSSFDPKVRHEIPKTSLFYTKYNGQKTLSNQLKKDFNDPDHRLGSPEQYLQAANLLMYYFMLLARDNPPIDEWAWALVENYEEWYRFPWGSWSFQILCHQMSVIKRDPSEIGGNRGAYHFYGAVWALNLWAYEAIPDLGLACGRRLNNHSTPRLLRWFTTTSPLDFVGYLDDQRLNTLTTLEPEPDEMIEPYMLTFFDSPDPLILRYDAPQRHAQKKIPPERRASREMKEMEKVVKKLNRRQGYDGETMPLRRGGRSRGGDRTEGPECGSPYISTYY